MRLSGHQDLGGLRASELLTRMPNEAAAGRSSESDASHSGLSSVTDTVTFSPEAQRALAAAEAEGTSEESGATTGVDEASDDHELTPQEKEKVAELERRDVEVRTHEQAHAATGGSHAGAPQYEYESGPDGRRYAVEGKVSISVSAVKGDPQATVKKMQTVRAAALAPAEPSGQDRAVAAQAAQEQSKAQAELAKQAREDSASETRSDEEAVGASEVRSPSGDEGAQRDPVLASAAGRRAYARTMGAYGSPAKGSNVAVAA